MIDVDLNKIIRAAEIYNKYRAPEAIAEFHSIRNNRIIFILKGSFCLTCGVYDWIDDLRIELMDALNRDIEIENIENIDFSEYKIIFRLK